MCIGGWVGWKWVAWHTAERKCDKYMTYISYVTPPYMTWYQGTGSSYHGITSRVVRAQCREYTGNTPGRPCGTSSTLYRSDMWRCKIVWCVTWGRSRALRNSYISSTHVPLITTSPKYILNIIYNILQYIRHRKATILFKEWPQILKHYHWHSLQIAQWQNSARWIVGKIEL